MDVYRVENKEGKGCYRKGYFTEWLTREHDLNFKKYPPPHYDKGIDRLPVEGELCGFKDKEQALDWFTQEELSKLRKLGFYLERIEGAEVTAIGEKQILFRRS